MLLRPMQRIVFTFIRISVDGEIIENDTKTIVWTENILSVFGAKTPFSNLSGLVWTGPMTTRVPTANISRFYWKMKPAFT